MKVTLVLAVISCIFHGVEPHGRLLTPPARNSMWRLPQYSTPNKPNYQPPNYNENQVFCGGAGVQAKNEGKCGICGDNYADSRPRAHEATGKWGNGIITGIYAMNGIMKVHVELTANHLGWMEFKLCENNDVKKWADPECFSHLLEKADGSGSRHAVQTDMFDFNLEFKLPNGVVCTQCILQWTYKAGNNWGICEDGKGALGCGDQEHFRNCADIAIIGDAHDPCSVTSCANGETCEVYSDGGVPAAKCVCSGDSCGKPPAPAPAPGPAPAPAPGPAPPAPVDPTKPFECPTKFGYFGNPSDCGSYYQCAHGQHHAKSCPEGLHFNSEAKVCDWPRNVDCTEN